MAKLMHKDESYTGGGGDTSDLIKWSEATTSVKKNLLENKGTAQTIVGVSFTINDNKSIKLNGTATNNNSNFVVNSYTIPAGQYILSKTGTSDVAFQVADDPVTRELYKATTSNVVMTFAQDTAIKVRVSLVSGKTYNNTTIYPMIRPASIEDDTYEPYIPDNTELMRYTDNAVLGAKNLLPNNATSQTVNGVTFTKNADGTITANGTATANTFECIRSYSDYGDVILSGCPSSGGQGKYSLQYSNFANQSFIDYGQGVIIPSTKNAGNWSVVIYIASGQTLSNVVFKPMIRLATDTDDTYVPYAMTNRELTEKHMSEYKEYTNMSNCTYFHMHRYGKVRVVTMALPTSVSATSYTIGTVDANDYPLAEVMFDCPTYIGIIVRFHIDTSGVVKLYVSGTSSSMNGVINAVYIAK